MKKCSRCGVTQPIINFSTRNASPDGLSPRCKICAAREKNVARARYQARTDEEIDAVAATFPPRPCRACKVVKPLEEFPRDRGRREGRSNVCLPCSAEATKYYNSLLDPEERLGRRRAERGNNRANYRKLQLKRSFGITPEQYAEMLAAQGGTCEICKKPETAARNGRVKDLAVDHCHNTNAVRRLLCSNCNHGLGHFKDDPALLRAAAGYLERHVVTV